MYRSRYLYLSLFLLFFSNAFAQYGSSVNWDTQEYDSLFYSYQGGASSMTMPYRLLEPINYNAADAQKYPLVIMLHGEGEGLAGKPEDPGYNKIQLTWGGKMHLDSLAKYPGFVLFPQTYGGSWASPDSLGGFVSQPSRSLSALIGLLEYVFKTYHIDLDRVYIHGLCAGARGVWEMAMRDPALFAAISPSHSPAKTDSAKTLLYTPIWIGQGGADHNPTPAGAQLIVNALKAEGANPVYTLNETTGRQEWPSPYELEPIYSEFPGVGHDGWQKLYESPQWLNWMFNQTKKRVRILGDSIACSDGSKSVTMGISKGFDGYQWRKDGVLIADSNGHTLTVAEPGVYQVRYQRKQYYFSGEEQWSDWSEPVKIKSNLEFVPEITALGSTALPALDGKTSVMLTAPGGYTWYSWSNGASTRSITVQDSGSYSVRVGQVGKCLGVSSELLHVTNNRSLNYPQSPTNLTGNILTSTVLKLQWEDNASNEDAFEIYRKPKEGSLAFLAKLGANSTFYKDSSFIPGSTYTYFVRAINKNGYSDPSNGYQIATIPDIAPPGTPSGLAVTVDDQTSANLFWAEATDNVSLNGYIVYLNGDSVAFTVNPDYSFTTLSACHNYAVYVKAVDVAGNKSQASNQVSFNTCFSGLTYNFYHEDGQAVNEMPDFSAIFPMETGHIDNFSLSPRGSVGDHFAFTYAGYINIPTTGDYTFYTSSDDGSRLLIDGALVVDNDGLHGTTEKSGSVSLTAGAHAIQVEFFEQAGGEVLEVRWEGPAIGKALIPSNVLNNGTPSVLTLPSTPQGLTLTSISSSRVLVKWQGTESRYEIERGMAPTGTFVHVGTVEGNTFRDSSLAASTQYYYRVKALAEVSEGAYSAVATITTASLPQLPGTPANLSASGGSNKIELNWEDTSSSEVAFVVELSTDNSAFLKITSLPENTTSYALNPVNSSVKHYFRVAAVNEAGQSAYSNTAIIDFDTIPNAPLNPVSTVLSAKQIQISWTDNSLNEKGFIVERQINGGDFIEIARIKADSSRISDAAENGDSLIYRIKSYNDFGISTALQFKVILPEEPLKPNTASWRIPADAVYIKSKDASKNTLLTTALKEKKDFFQKINLAVGDSFVLAMKLPVLQNDGMFTFNIKNSYTKTRDVSGVFTKAFYSSNSTNGIDGDWAAMDLYTSGRTNQLQKLDLDKSMGGKWIKLEMKNNDVRDEDLTEFALYQFPLTGKPQYFLVFGASIMEASGSLEGYKKQIDTYFSGKGYDPVIFNLALAGSNSYQLEDSIDTFLSRHPKAQYVFIHTGGNNVTPDRPLTYDKLDASKTQAFLEAMKNIIEKVKQADKTVFMADLTFRNYPVKGTQPAVNGGLNQENGSLPFNYLLNQILAEETPEFYDPFTRRAKVDFYPTTLNNQDILNGDGIHPYGSKYDGIRMEWIDHAMQYVYEGTFAPPLVYNEYVPELVSKATNAVVQAESSLSGSDIWTARILVEQIGDASIRVPLHIRLDEIDSRALVTKPYTPSALEASTVQGGVQLTWKDNAYNAAGFEIYRAKDSTTFGFVGKSGVSTTSFTDSTVAPNTSYLYKIVAVNKAGASPFSNTASATTTGSDTLYFDGEIDNLWSSVQNWSENSLPGSFSYVKLDNTLMPSAYSVHLDSAVAPFTIEVGGTDTVQLFIDAGISSLGIDGQNSLTIHPTGKVFINKSLTLRGNVILDGTLEVAADSLTIAGNITGTGKLIVSPGCVFTYSESAASIFPASYGTLVTNSDTVLTFSGKSSVTGSLALVKGQVNSNDNLSIDLNTGYIEYNPSYSGVLQGKVHVEKDVTHNKYTYISTGLNNVSSAEFKVSTNYFVSYMYDETPASRTAGNSSSGWSALPPVITSGMSGLAVYFLNKGTLSYAGDYNNGAGNANLTYSNIAGDSSTDGWNLIGNPFLGNLDWDLVSATLDTNYVEKAIYIFDGGAYTSYVDGFPTGQGLNIISPLQSFFVHVKQPYNLIINKNCQSNGTKHLYRKAASADQLEIAVTSSTTSDKTYVRFLPEASKRFDASYDAFKMYNEGNIPSLYTDLYAKEYAINSIPAPSDSITLDLRFMATSAVDFTLAFNEMAAFDGYTIVLSDSVTGYREAIQNQSTYTFRNIPSVQNRFKLTFIKEGLATTPKAVSKVIARVNCGGMEIAADPISWSLDRQASPSGFLNPNSSNNTTGSNFWRGENTTDAPAELLGTNRLDGPWGGALQYDFPVENGNYLVKLYFAEKPNGIKEPGERVFDVLIENAVVTSDLDIYAAVQSGALQKNYFVDVEDGMLNISFNRKVNNPQINGIEIVSQGTVDTLADLELAVFPNPFNDSFTGKIDEGYTGAATIAVFDAQGFNALTEAIQVSDGYFSISNLNEFAYGIYILRVVTPTHTYWLRIQKE